MAGRVRRALARRRPGAAALPAACAGLVLVLLLLPVVGAATASAVTTSAVTASGLFAAGAVAWGTHRHRPVAARAWWALATAAPLMLLGVLVRPWSAAQTGPLQHVGDLLTLAGYLVIGWALVRLVRVHGGLRREVLCDALVLTVAGALAALSHLVVPAVAVPGRPLTVTVLAGLYPLIDVFFLALLVDLTLSGPRLRSHRLLLGALLAMLVGDLGYAVMGTWGQLSGPPVVDVPFALAFLLLGTAGLHPSQRQRHRPVPRTDGSAPHAWSTRRLVLLAASLAGLVVAAGIPGPDAQLHRWASALAVAVAFALLLVRGVSAVNGHARAREVLRRRASHDALTDLPNRVEVLHLAEEALARPRPAGTALWMLYVDLDGFRRVNDGWGHGAGDELIQHVAHRLRAQAPAGAVVGRLAGDEFVLLLEGTEEQALDLAVRVLAAVVQPAHLSSCEVVVSASVGVAPARVSAVAGLRDADAAMHRAKASGRNRWALFDESMRRDIGEDIELELELRHAVAEGRLEVAYQPVVDLATGFPVGVEALLRWNRPVLGPVPPARFVPVLEETGLITAVGAQVLREALGQLARWRAEGVVDESFVMSVNVSPRQLLDPAFPALVRGVLHEAGVGGGCLLLEITESSMLREDELTLQVLHGLRELGAGLAVDDFGTGYSALSYLRRFPVTRVKVDRSFVHGMCRDAGDAALVRAVEAMSRALGLAVTAEGVETVEQRDALRAIGVRHGQGWLWGRAEPAAPCGAALRAVRAGGPWPAMAAMPPGGPPCGLPPQARTGSGNS